MIEIRNKFKEYSLDTYVNLDNIQRIDNFLVGYDKIQKQDFIKPVFTLTKKYSNYSNKKNDSEWKKYEASSENEKIEEIIKSNMNKISKNTFGIISKKLVCDIKKIENSSVLEIISRDIYQKTIHDIKFQSIYLEVIKNIWMDKTFYHNLVTIKKESNKFYWVPKNGQFNNKFRGPFNNIKELDENIYSELSLKKVFINTLQNHFLAREKYMDELLNSEDKLEDEEKYKLSRKIFGFYEIVIKLYYSGDIPLFLINYILNKLVNFAQNSSNKDCFYIECTHVLMRLLVTDKNFNSFRVEKTLRKSHVERYLELINGVDKSNYPKREQFMLLDIKDYLTKLLGTFTFVPKGTKQTPIKKPINYEVDIKENLLKNHYKKITFLLKNNMESINDNLLTLFDYLFEYQAKKDIVLNILEYLMEKNILKTSVLESVFNEVEQSLDDIELDIVNVKEFYKEFKNNVLDKSTTSVQLNNQ